MNKVVFLALLLVASQCLFTEDISQKYSIEIIEPGEEGTAPERGQTVEMHYDGETRDGIPFDSSYKRNAPLEVRIGTRQVIPCWDDVGLQMNLHQKIKVICPASTAYGDREIGPIPANSDLVFIMERVK